MRIESLILFLSVVEKQSISHAARQAHISQQGASATIKNIEHELDIVLFERNNNTLQLTEVGRRFAEEARRVVASYERLRMVAVLGDVLDKGDESPLKVVTTPFTLHAFSSVFDAYRDTSSLRNPLVLTERSLFDIVAKYPHLDPQALYIVNVPAFMTALSEKIQAGFTPLITHELMLCCCRDSSFADKAVVSKGELTDTPIACYNEELLMRLIRHLFVDTQMPEISLQTSNMDLVYRAITEEHMVTFTDSFSVFGNRLQSREVAIPLEEDIFFTTGILGSAECDNAHRFVSFFERYLTTVCATYMKAYPVDFGVRGD